MTQDARVVLLGSAGTTNLRATWSDNPAATWASAPTQNLPEFQSGTSSVWVALAYAPALNLLAAVSGAGVNNLNQIATSGDGGTSWVGRPSPGGATTFLFTDICWAPRLGLFVACSSAGPTTTTRIATSPDGKVWTAQVIPTASITLSGICCGTISGADFLVAVGSAGAVFTSTDGVTWTSQTAASSQTWTSVLWNSGQSKFVACANSGSGVNNIMYSSDGVAWTSASTSPSATFGCTKIAYSSDLDQMIAVGGNTGEIVYSTAGSVTAWTKFTTGLGTSAQTGVTWSHDYNTWVICGFGFLYTCATVNGTWVSQTLPNANRWAVALAIPASTVLANNIGVDYIFTGSGNVLGIMAGFNGVNTHTMTIFSTQVDELILLFIENECLVAAGAYATVSTVTGGSGLTWARYGSPYQYRGGPNGASPNNYNNMEIWYAYASAVQTSQTITITTSQNVDGLSCCSMGIIGADPSSPFDPNVSLPATANNGAGGSATAPSVSGVSTTHGGEITFAFAGQPRAASTATPPTGYTTVYAGGNSGGTNAADQQVAYNVLGSSALSSATVTFTNTILNWGMMVAAVQPVQGPPTGTWASTEADDTMSFPGGVLGGSWASTEAEDTAFFVSVPVGSWLSTDTKDSMAFVGHPELAGSWHSTEVTDTMSATGLGAHSTTFDPLTASPGVDFQNLNMTVVNQEAFGQQVGAKSNTTQSTGKFYVEFRTRLNSFSSGVGIGNAIADFTNWSGTISGPARGAVNGAGTFQFEDGTIWINGIQQSNWEAVTLDNAVGQDVIVRVAIDLDNDLIWFSIGGGFWNGLAGGNPSNGVASPRPPSNQPQVGSGGYDISAVTAHGPIYLWTALVNGYDSVTLNAGATAFTYSVPSGFTAWDGSPLAPAPLQIDGYASSGVSETGPNFDALTSGTITLSTTQPNDVIVLGIATGGARRVALVDSITSTSGLVWKRRNQRWQVGGFKSGSSTVISNGLNNEIWWAHAPAALSGEVITVHMDPTSNGTGGMAIVAFGVSGANYTTPWDTHTLAGGYVDQVGNLFFSPAMSSLYTKAKNTFLFGFHGDTQTDSGDTTVPWTYVTSALGDESNGFKSFLSLVYQVVEEPQINTDVVVGQNVAGIGDCFTAQCVMFDSIVAAGETGTDKGIVWFWDPQSHNNIVRLSTGTTLQLSYSATNFNLMVIIEVAIMSASGLGEVTSISESQGSLSTTGFERRSRKVTSTPLGPLAVEIWWGWMPMYTLAERANNDTITINTANCGPGDIIGAIMMGLGGTTGAFGLGDPFWDNDPSLPAENSSTSGSPPPYATDISTTIASDLVVAWTANNTQFEPGFTDPFVSLVQDPPRTIVPNMQIISNAPPFFTDLEFYYEPGLATNETAEFLVPTEPNGWVVIADAIPVGPPQPPSGTMHPTDQQDKFTHTGNFTSIGIASPGGWVGAPENSGVMAAVGHPDINGGTPNLGYSPFLGEGWLGGVAAHATWASTEGDDQMALYGWVLGFGITGQLNAAGAKDRMASGNRPTVTGTMGAAETKDRWASAGLVLPPGRIHPTPPQKRILLIIT